MADLTKPSIGNSVTYKIGGRDYSASDVSRLQLSQTRNAKTGTDISRESEQKVQTQTDNYNKTKAHDPSKTGIQSQVSSTPRAVESIKTSTTEKPSSVPYKPSAQRQPGTLHVAPTPTNSAQSASSVQSSGTIKTQSAINRESEQKVQSQTDNYKKTGVYDLNKTGIQSEAQRTPRTVEGIKTGTSHTMGTSEKSAFRSPHNLQTQDGTGYTPQIGVVSRTVGNTPYVATGNVKTQSSISGEAIQSIQNQTNSYNKSETYNTQEPFIRDRVDKSPVNIAGIRTGSVQMTQGTHTSFFEAVNSMKNKPFSLTNSVTMAAGKTESALSGQDDFGAQSAGAVISAGMVGVETFRATQSAVDIAPSAVKTVAQGIYKAGKGVYQVGLTGGLAMVAVSRTATFVQAGQFQAISHASMQMLKTQALAAGLNHTAVSQGIIHAVNGIQTKLKNGIQTAEHVVNQIKTGYHIVKNGVETGIRVVRGVTNGTISATIIKGAIARYTNKAVHVGVKGIKTGLKTGIRTGNILVVKGVTKGVPFVTRKTFLGMEKLYRPFVGVMQSTDDWTLQGAANIATSTEIGLKTAVAGMKATRYTVHTAVKGGISTGRTTVAAGRFIKNNGLKAAWDAGRRKAARAAAEAGKSFVTAIVNAIKILGKKALIPMIVIVLVVMGFNGVIIVPVTAVSSIFSSMFSTSDTNADYDVREYLNTIVPGLSTEFQQDLANQMAQSWNSYNIVRFYSNTGSAEVIEPTLTGIMNAFPTTEELLNMVQPVFNAVVLMQYELEPTELEAKNLTEDIFSRLFTITTETSTEYCGQNIITGEGTPLAAHSCGYIHALDDCPNKDTGTHSSYTCSDCCYYYCPGHDDGEGGTDYCDGCQHACDGYSYCGSHSVISYTLSVDGIYRLEAEYFLDPIEELSNKPIRTDDEETKLQELKDYYEIFQEMMSQVSINYGGGLTMADLSGVIFINGTRTSNQEVIDLALSQVGQVGGQPYWSYYGFSNRVEWCACFVHWCMRHTPSASGAYPTTSNNAYCQTVANNFMNIGQWGDRSYTNVVAGDTIFFDWQGDGHTDHIGLVIGTDGTNVYTVEGNSGDAVKVKSYPIGSGVIYGYGLMNY